MAEKKSWRDYSKYDSSGYSVKGSEEDEESKKDEESKEQEKTGSWRDYSQYDTGSLIGQQAIGLVNRWLNNHNSYISDYQNRFSGRNGTIDDAYVSDSADWLDAMTKRSGNLDAEATEIMAFLEENKYYLDQKAVQDIIKTINDAKGTHSQIVSGAQKDHEYWNSFGSDSELVGKYGSAQGVYEYYQRGEGYRKKYEGLSADDLNWAAGFLDDGEEKEWLTSYASNAAYKEKSDYDIAAGMSEIAAMEQEVEYLSDYLADAHETLTAYYGAEYDQKASELFAQYGGSGASLLAYIEKKQKEIEDKKKYIADAQTVQEYNKEAEKWNVYTTDANFGAYAQQGAAIENPTYGDAQGWLQIGNWRAGAEDIGNIVTFSRDNYNNVAGAMANGGIPVGDILYARMTEDEVKLHNAILAKDGKAVADQYLAFLKPQLQNRESQRMADLITSIDIPVIEDLAIMGYGLGAGVDQWASGVKQFFSDEQIDPSMTQQTNAYISNSLDGIGYYAHQAATTIGNMAPSILASSVLGAAGASTAVAGGVGSTVMGVSAAGNAYADALSKGYDKASARTYSTLVGASEGLLQYLIGGIGELGGISSKLAGKVAAIDNGLLRAVARIGVNIGGEIIEEEAQNLLEPLFRTILFGEEYDAPTIEEMIETAIVTALSTGVLEVGGVIKEGMADKQTANTYSDTESVKALIESGLESDKFSESYQLAMEYKSKIDAGETLNGAEIRQLIEANDAAIANEAKEYKASTETIARNKLTELGETENVNQIAKLVAKQVSGAELTAKEKSTLVRSKYGSQVAKELRGEVQEEVGTKSFDIKSKTETTPYTPLVDRTEAKYILNKDGKATVNGEAIDLNKATVASVGKDGMTLRVDGEEVSVSDIEFEDSSQGFLYSAVSQIENITPGAATVFVHGYDSSSGVTVGEYLNGIDEAYTYGYHGYSVADLKAGQFTGKLSEKLVKDAYGMGKYVKELRGANKAEAIKKMRTAVEAEVAKAKAENKEAPSPKKLTITYNAGNGRVSNIGKFGKNLSKQQKAGIAVAKVLHNMGLGTQFEFFSSYVNSEGVRVFLDENGVEQEAYSGVYRMSDGTIRIDMNAYNGKGLTLDAMSHELTHFIQQWSTEKYKTLAEFLVKTYEKTDMSMHQRVLREQARLKGIRGKEVSYSEAYDEVVANAMGKMLSDPKVMEKITELKAKDADLAKKLWEGFKRILNKFFRVYETEQALFFDTADLMEMKEEFEQIKQMWAEAFVEASENFQAAQIVGFEMDLETESVSPAVMHSEHTWTESDYVQQRNTAAKEIAKAIGVSEKKAKAYIDSVNSIAKMIAEDRSRLDYFSSPGRSSFVSNAEYGGSFDFSTLCKKRRLLTGTFTAIQKALPNTALTANEILDIRNRMKEKGLEVSCGLCYVEGSRANMGQFAKEFLRLYKQYYPDAWQPNMADVNTPDGIEWVRINHPECYEQYEYFWNHYGTLKEGDKNLFASQQKPKLYQLHTEYKGEILKEFKNDDKVEDKNTNGGIRLQSFSDFEIVHLIDTMQIIMDMSRVGLAGQAYTKVPDFAWALGDTGLKINLSLIAKGVDENGKLIFDDVEGMPISDAMKLRDRYSKNVGTILVAFNDEQLLAAMADDRVDFIIPFHRSQWKKSQYEAMGLPAKTKDYTFMQNEKFIKPTFHEYRGRMVKDKATNYMPNEYWDFSKTGKENAEAYLEMCARNNKRPKFYKFLQDNGDGSYSLRADGSTEGYWKLLIDFKMYDNDGDGSPQMPVKPDFNMEEATRMLNDYSGGHSNFPVAQGIVDSFVKDYKASHKGEQYSSQETDFEGYDTRNLAWAIESGIINDSDQARFWEAIAEIQKLKYNSFTRTKNGAYIIETKDKMMFTDGDFKTPTLSKVICFTLDGGKEVDYTRRMIRDEAERTGRTDKSVSFAEGLYGSWFIAEYNVRDYHAYARQDGTGEGTDSQGTVTQGEGRGVRHGGKNGLQAGHDVNHDFLAEGKLKGNYTVSDISEMFDAWNSEPELADLSKKVFAKLQEIMDGQKAAYWATPYPIRFKSDAYMQKEFYIAPHGVFEPSRTDGNYGITYNLDYFRKTSDQDKARILLHEAIHACTVGAIKSTERLIPKQADPMVFRPGDNWSDTQKAALELIQVFSQVRVANERTEYGQKNVYEMVAEMSNPEFRAMLKKQNLWSRIVDAIKRIFGIEQRTAFDAVSDALEKILELDMQKPNGEVYSSQETDLDNAPTFYSQMGKVVEGMKQDKFGASSVISMLRGRGVKAEEIRWSGIHAFLDGKKSVTKTELLDFIKGSMLQIEEETRSKNDTRTEFVNAWRSFVDRDLEYSEITAGLDNLDEMESYLESLVEDGDLDRFYADYILEVAKKVDNRDLPAKWDAYTLDGGENYRELVFKMPGSDYTNTAMQVHWDDEKGVLAHARIQDFNTFIGKMLFIEEIQSDWHNAGHKNGYRQDGQRTEQEISVESSKAYRDFYMHPAIKSIDSRMQNNGYYNAPTVLARLFDGDASIYDFLARIGVEISADEKNIIDQMVAEETKRKEELKTAAKTGAVPDAPFKDNYHEYVLKRLIRMAAEQGYDSIGWTTADIQSQRYSADFAEGYRIEYDQDIPKFLKKYGKQWDSTVGKTVLDNGTEVWSMAITDSMKQSVLKEGQALYSTHETDNITNRDLLANAFEGITNGSEEYKLIQRYKGYIAELNSLENKLSELNREIRSIRFEKGKYDAEKLNRLEAEKKTIADAISKYDQYLLSLEASAPLRRVIENERKKASDKTKEHVREIQQSKKLRAEQTELRHKIRKAIRDLDKVLNRGNKKQNVKEELQPVVTKALQSAEILFTDNYNTYDMLRNGIRTDLSDAEEAFVKSCAKMIKDLDAMPTDGYENWQAYQEAESRLKTKMSKLNEVFARERKRLNNTTVSSILGELADAYASLAESELSYVQGVYNEPVHNFLKNLQKEVGGTIVQDMTKGQLESVYAAYQMVLTTVRKANQMFNEGLKLNREQLANAVIEEVIQAGGVNPLGTKMGDAISQFNWNNTKPIWVANRIGSNTFGMLMGGLFQGQYNFAVDIDEVKKFKLSMDEKYRPRAWDAEKLYEFESSTGKKFKLNLQQIMSLYAFSKREQAYSHLLNGGFVFEENSTVVVDGKLGIKKTYIHKGATSYKLNEATLNGIINSLTTEQKAYVDEMQAYLSDVMGAKGNEVSMALYGIKMFKEKFYFPLRSSGDYMEKAKEAEMKKQQGQINLVNSGFTHSVKPEARNPIILSGFMDVWADHCNEMSMYHSMVLPMEDFRKVYNYSTRHEEGADSYSVHATIKNAYGKEATDYIDQLYRELNAGATVDPRETPYKKLISNFKKAAVMLSGSVWVQQFSSIGRAYAVIDPKYFAGKKVDSGTNLSVAEEMKKYAPVAIIKEMGGFDTGTKGSATSYIKAEKYGKGERIKGFLSDEQYRGDLMGFMPQWADEKTWCAIWEACKRETKVKNPNMDVKSDEFLKLVGNRFSEVIEKTQVYDSVLARSANMRSKSNFMAMATAFMAEPTTTVNLLEDAIRSGNAKHIARAFGSVAVSILLNNALASVVYAMRDDDDDETFIEKYFQAFTSGLIDDINPMSYYPFLKDVWSLFQGYDVERSDMSVIADVRDALKRVVTLMGKDTSNMTDDQLVEHYKTVNEAFMGILDAGCSAFGVPLKNVRRDVNGLINAFSTIGEDLSGERKTTWLSFWDKVGASVKDTIPVYAYTKDEAKTDKLYRAITNGDKAYEDRLKKTYKDESAYNTAVVKALRDNDPRIKAAAQAGINGDSAERNRILQEIKKEGKFSSNLIIDAINAETTAIRNKDKPEKVHGQYGAYDFVEAVSANDAETAKSVRQDIIDTYMANGKTQAQAESAFESDVRSSVEMAYSYDTITKATAEKMLVDYAGMDEDDAADRITCWDFLNANPDCELTESKVLGYLEYAEPARISLEIYEQFVEETKGIKTIKDKWGEVEKSERDQVLEVIDSLPLTWQQKDALYLAAGYAESKIWDVPW